MLTVVLILFVLFMLFLAFVSFVNRNNEELEFISNQGKKEAASQSQFDNRIEVGSTLWGLEFKKLDGTVRCMEEFHVKKIVINRSGKVWIIGLEEGKDQKSFYLDRVISIRTVDTF